MNPGESGPTGSEKTCLFDLFEEHEEDVLLGAVYIRIVDSFLTYIADVLAEVHLAKPETLPAKEIKVARILNRKQEDWLAELAEERVDSLVRGGFNSIIEDVGKSLGVRLAPDDRAMAAVVDAVEVRNVLVHNRGVVDRRAASKLNSTRATSAERSTSTSRDSVDTNPAPRRGRTTHRSRPKRQVLRAARNPERRSSACQQVPRVWTIRGEKRNEQRLAHRTERTNNAFQSVRIQRRPPCDAPSTGCRLRRRGTPALNNSDVRERISP